MNTDHVVFSYETQGFQCRHCGGQHAPSLPMDVATLVSVGKGFGLMHKHCQKPVEPTRQLPLPHTEETFTQRHGLGGLAITREARASVALDKDPDCGTRVCEGIDGSSDEPDPETDPPPPDLLDVHYPIPRTTAALRNAFEHALTPEQMTALDEKAVESWHPDSGIFHAVSRWARVMWAREDAPGKPPVGMYIPLPPPVPEALKQALGLPNKMPRKKATTRKAGK